jgi:ubiquinone/menaquinone biosynthesis C-methylase UbiE
MTDEPQGKKKERPSTYVVQDRQNQEERLRVTIQDQMITASMGGIVPEQEDPSIFTSVLDVACGTGGWLIEAAKTYPNMTKLVGVDISASMTDYARSSAEREQVADRVTFRVMDTLRLLEFPKDSFDLINLRFGISWLRTWDWAKLLAELQRVAKRRGIIRITEGDMGQSNSPALTHLVSALQEAFYKAGHLFRPEKDGITSELVPLLIQHGLEQVQTHEHLVTYRAGTPEGDYFAQDVQHGLRTVRPYIQKWSSIVDNYDTLYQQAMEEIQQPNFVATVRLVTVWGTRAIIVK